MGVVVPRGDCPTNEGTCQIGVIAPRVVVGGVVAPRVVVGGVVAPRVVVGGVVAPRVVVLEPFTPFCSSTYSKYPDYWILELWRPCTPIHFLCNAYLGCTYPCN